MILEQSQTFSAAYPPLLVAAQHLAHTAVLGDHGRRRPGIGDVFWQYRLAQPGDGLRQIDWRRSARSDDTYVRDAESQIAHSLLFWCDPGASMNFGTKGVTKRERAHLLTLALAHLALRAGERVGVTGGGLRLRTGQTQLDHLHTYITHLQGQDYETPNMTGVVPHASVVFLSDFLGPLDALDHALAQAVQQGISGTMVMILDPQEQDFPFRGRSVFHSIGRSLKYDTGQATDLKADYTAALGDRINRLQDLARAARWRFHVHS
ncbi:MAG: DUF58 domain-containing protein, partial [Pseudomonadota bacterium]